MEIFLKILWPLLILLAIAFTFGLILSIAGKKLEVKVDQKEQDVLGLLSGANCGACGFPGCAGFAKALTEGKVEIASCAATSKENKAKIKTILGTDGDDEDVRIVVCCGGGNKCSDKFNYIGYEDCIMANNVASGFKSCATGCLGFGSCANLCPLNAIVIENAVATVNDAKCGKCKGCIKKCPKQIIKAIPHIAKVYINCTNHNKGKQVKDMCKVGCISCGLCVKNCKVNAIEMVDNLPVIDYGKCTGCFDCVAKCPTKCIAKF